ncbi:MAG: hypothetical protein KIG95_00635 [Comamonas sp.]|nr:hypothetical protein [Comamonas sp.]
MSYDIQHKITAAKAAYDAALTNLEAKRATFNDGLKSELSAAFDKQKSLNSKIAENHASAQTAEKEFKQAFEAAGFERTNTVLQALNRKNDALAMIEELEGALAKTQSNIEKLLLEASPEASALLNAYRTARQRFGEWQAFEAMGEPSSQLIKAIALAWQTIPPASSSAFLNQDLIKEPAQRVAFIWDGIIQMARDMNEEFPIPFSAANISPLKTSDLLTPGQTMQLKNKLRALEQQNQP